MLQRKGPSPKFRFGPFEVDPQSQELRKSGVRIRLQKQPSGVLLILLSRPYEVVSREELRQILWADDTFVDFEHGVNAAVNRLRQALLDSADPPGMSKQFRAQGTNGSAQSRLLTPSSAQKPACTCN
jgi:DNA-binding response OmpR family regulator